MLAAPAIVHAGNLMPVKVMEPINPIFMDGDLLFDGVIVRNQEGAELFQPSRKLVEYALEIQREYVRSNLFCPFIDRDEYAQTTRFWNGAQWEPRTV